MPARYTFSYINSTTDIGTHASQGRHRAFLEPQDVQNRMQHTVQYDSRPIRVEPTVSDCPYDRRSDPAAEGKLTLNQLR
jgi:hypothetical protein